MQRGNPRTSLIAFVADRLRNSGRTMDEDSWAEVMAIEAIIAIEEFARYIK